MGDKAAVKSRKRRELGIECSEDIGIRATFFCSRCKHPFCENCLGLEDGKKLFCLACAAIERTKNKEKNKHRKVENKVATPLKVILIMLVIIAGYLFIAGEQSSRPKRATLPPLTPLQEENLVKCKENLQVLSMLISEYQLTQGHDPEVIEDVILLKRDTPLLFEPVRNYEYGLELMPGKGLVVSCPNPDAHQLDSLYAQPGGPAVAVQEPGQ
jgi:hypothetical protein